MYRDVSRFNPCFSWIAAVLLALAGCTQPPPRGAEPQGATDGPKFVVDPFWPKPLKDNGIFAQIAGLAVDARDHVWVVHRPRSLLADEKNAKPDQPTARCCTMVPPVTEFDADGNLVQGWGGPGQGYDWPKNEHGIYVDAADHVWLAGNDPADNMILKFTRDGKFLMQIGHPGKSEGSNSKTQLGRPANMEVDIAANELYVADGYGNKRIVVFDATTGTYKRHWGAYGGVPSDDKMPAYSPSAPPSKQFANSVHCVRLSKDGLVYVCDRGNDRIQVFQKNGTFVTEFLGVQISALDTGDLLFSPDPAQRHIYIGDGQRGQIHILSRSDGKLLGSFGRHGRYAGEFRSLHNLATDSKGNIYTGEAGFGRRVQKFVRVN
jgi:DNA-binding beta-propeller fold protein YncE